MSFRRLFEVCIRHEYWGGHCPDLRLEPRDPEDVRALARHRLLARTHHSDLEVLVPVDADGAPVVAVDGLRLALALRVTGPEFVHYTAEAALAGGPTFRASLTGPLVRSDGAPGGRADATVEVSGVSTGWLQEPPRFTLELPARRPLWVFYAFTRRTDDVQPELHDEDATRAIGFTRVALTPDSVAVTDDPVGHRLAVRHSGHRGFRFTSDRPIPGSRAPRRQLALRLGGDLLLQELPNPPIDSHMTLRVEPTAEPSEALFRVIEY